MLAIQGIRYRGQGSSLFRAAAVFRKLTLAISGDLLYKIPLSRAPSFN